MPHLLLAVTGASGSLYALRFLEAAAALPAPPEVTLVLSAAGARVFARETGRDPAALGFPNLRRAGDDDLFHPLASGTNAPDAMLVAPCSVNSAAKIAAGIADTLILRAASNMLKLRRPLSLLVREMPLSTVMLRNLLALSEAGATVCPAAPHFYHDPRGIDDLVDSVTGYLFRLAGLPERPAARWVP